MSRATQQVFPVPAVPGLPNGEVLWGESGLTIREHFAVNAPNDPQPWFRPVMPPRPEVPAWSSIQDEKTRKDVFSALDCGTDPETPEGIAFCEHQREMETKQLAWRLEYERQRCIQWPAAWADAVLADLARPVQS